MKILAYERDGTSRAGLLVADQVFDVAELLASTGMVTAAIPDFGSMLEYPEILPHLRELHPRLVNGPAALHQGEALVGSVDEVRLLPPVQRPSKIVCAGLNYADHAAEIGVQAPANPLVFAKFASALSGPRDPIVHPAVAREIDHEVELAIVIGSIARNVTLDEALQCVAGYMVINDVSARDWQFGVDQQLTMGKGFDTFLPSGPWVTTRDEVPDPHRLAIQCSVDGEVVQSSSTSYLIKGVFELVSWISTVCTLHPGDIVATGTPGGVGVSAVPKRYLRPGQIVECEIEQLGTLRNVVVLEES